MHNVINPHHTIQRLDPAVMHVSCNQAGTLLARIGRPEVATCIAALEQYSVAYEEAALQAAEIKQIFGQSSMGEVEFSHMASVMSVSRQNEARKRESEDLMNCEIFSFFLRIR